MKDLLLFQPWEYIIILFIVINAVFFSKVQFVLNRTFMKGSTFYNVPDNKYRRIIYPVSWNLIWMLTIIFVVIIFMHLIIKIGFWDSFIAFTIILPTSIILTLFFPVTTKYILKSCLKTIESKLGKGSFYSSEEIEALSNYKKIVSSEIGLFYVPNRTRIHNICFKLENSIDFVSFNSKIIVVQKDNIYFTGTFDEISEFENLIVGSGKIALEKDRDEDGLVKDEKGFDFKITVSFNLPSQEDAKISISSKILNVSTGYIPRTHGEKMDKLVNKKLNKAS